MFIKCKKYGQVYKKVIKATGKYFLKVNKKIKVLTRCVIH